MKSIRRALLLLLAVLWTVIALQSASAQERQGSMVGYPTVPVAEVLRSQPGDTLSVRGVVTIVLAEGYVFIQDASGSMRLVIPNSPPLVTGDEIQAIVQGVSNPRDWFRAVRVERIGSAALPEPQFINASTATAGLYDASFVTVRGRVLRTYRNQPNYEVNGQWVVLQRDVLTIDADGVIVDVSCDPADHVFERIPIGTLAEFTGACRFPDQPSNGEPARAFTVAMRGLDRVRVLEWPPVWLRPGFRTWLERGLIGVGIVIAGFCGWLGWRWRRRQIARASEMRFRALVENSFDGVMVFKPDGKLVYRNPGAARLFGETIRGDLFLQTGMSSKIHPDDAPRIIQTMHELLERPGNTSSTISYRVQLPGGGTRFVEAIGTNCLDVSGIEGVVINVRDITDRQVAEEKLREANASLEQRVAERTADLTRAQEELRAALKAEQELSELRANFVSLVSHEFRTPLGVIMSSADILRLFYQQLSDDKREHYVEMITRSTRTLANLIEEVLLIRRVEEGRMRFEPVPVEIKKLCGSLVDEVLSASHHICPIELINGVPLEGARSDETLLRHILSNVLSNAVKYSHAGQPVEFAISRDQSSVIFTVRDHGIGILPEDKGRLFNSFMRGRNVGSRPGTGLGLIVVKRCVDLHGGSLELDSTPGIGTTIVITLPVFRDSVLPVPCP